MSTLATTFLSTVIGTSGALVAIIGGLLVARFVGLGSEQQASTRLLREAEERLKTARAREGEAHFSFTTHLRNELLEDPDVIAALSSRTTVPTVADIRSIYNVALEGFELQILIDGARSQVESTRQAADRYFAQPVLPLLGWAEFKQHTAYSPLPPYDSLGRFVYNEMAATERKRRVRSGWLGVSAIRRLRWSSSTHSVPQSATPTAYVVADVQRRHELGDTDARTEQLVEDTEAEVSRLRKEHDSVTRPDRRLWVAVAILAYFAGAGIGWPLWQLLMGYTALMATFFFFMAGLTALLLFMAWYLASLQRLRPWSKAR